MIRTLPNFLTEQQMVCLATSPDPGSIEGLRDRALIGLLCGSGLRASELVALRVFDLGSDLVHIRRGKGGVPRWVPLAPRTAAAIRRYLAAQPAAPGDFVFRRLEGQALDRRLVHKIVARYQRTLKLKTGLHLLRASAATRWLNRGVSLQSVRAMLGHQSISTTAIYLGVATDALVAEYQKCVGAATVG